MTRAYEALNVVIRSFLALFFAWVLVPSSWRGAVILALLVVIAGLAYRGGRIQLEADDRRLVVRNYWKTYVVPWHAITKIVVGSRIIALATQPAVLIYTQDRRLPIKVHATPIRREARWMMWDALKALAPEGVPFESSD